VVFLCEVLESDGAVVWPAKTQRFGYDRVLTVAFAQKSAF
jgi:hypothetical protein